MENKLLRLGGLWQITTDPDNSGRDYYYKKDTKLEKKDIFVPSVVQEAFPFYDGVAWYFKSFENTLTLRENERAVLKFNAVDYLCEVWLNESYLGLHEDGEESFSFDVTELLCGENYLAVRVLVPYEDEIDGITLNETPHRNKANRNFTPGSTLDVGGILQDVELCAVPEVRITDVFARPDAATGVLSLDITVKNGAKGPLYGTLSVHISENRSTLLHTFLERRALMPPGETAITLSVRIENARLWSFEDPFLYLAQIELVSDTSSDRRLVRFGFRELRVENGFFFLNGKRIFLKSSHTGNHMPVGILMSRDADMLRRDFLYAKALGLNTIRFIAGTALPEQLDFCDEIGLLVYEECSASWLLAQSDKMGERFDRATRAMLRRDRNHPSVVIWGLLNETAEGAVYRHARDFLPELRKIDDTRLVLLSSGRWDAEHRTGSLSNPKSPLWECQWGEEGAYSGEKRNPQPAYADGMGDVHIYPSMPETPEATAFIRGLGQKPGEKPVFVSEYGHSSQNNVFREYAKFAQNGFSLDGEDAVLFKTMAQRFEKDWITFGFEGSRGFASDFLTESMWAQCRLRQKNFDAIRSNPMICGYNITGLLDHALTGEGLWSYWRELKPGMGDTVPEGLAPLRWCLFCEKNHVYAGRPFKIEAVLANEDVLRPGKYDARFLLRGPQGVIWSRDVRFTLPASGYGGMPPLAVTVLAESVVIEGPGEYELAAELLSGGAPQGGRQKIHVSQKARPRSGGGICFAGDDGTLRGFFCEDGNNAGFTGLTLASAPDTAEMAELLKLAREGGTVVFLNPEPFSNPDTLALFPMLRGGKLVKHNNWLYHLDGITKIHPVFKGLMPGRLMEADFYDTLFPSKFFSGVSVPDNTLCAAFGVGQPTPGGYLGGPVICEYACGHGTLVFCALDILPNLGKNPAADILLSNLAEFYSHR